MGRILPKSSLPFKTYSELGGSKSTSKGGSISKSGGKSKAKASEGARARAGEKAGATARAGAGARDAAEAGAKASAEARARAGARARPLKSGSRDRLKIHPNNKKHFPSFYWGERRLIIGGRLSKVGFSVLGFRV